MNLAGFILKRAGWSIRLSVPDYAKCIICVAPHTSNWDFILGKLAYAAVGRRAGFLMKSTWFFPPLGWIFRAMGGIPVYRGKDKKGKGSLTAQLVELFRSSTRLTVAITPEGTRSRTSAWHTGFLHISRQAGVPIVLGALDFKTKTIYLEKTIEPSGDIEADMRIIKDYYKQFTGKIPQNFTTE